MSNGTRQQGCTDREQEEQSEEEQSRHVFERRVGSKEPVGTARGRVAEEKEEEGSFSTL